MRTPSLVVAIVAVGIPAAACSKPQALEPAKAQPVKTQLAMPAPAPSGVRYSTSIEAAEQVPLAFKAAGYVDDLLQRRGADGKVRAAQQGDRIPKGTVLARVREAEYRERVNQGRARVAESEASLVKARLDLERARTLFAADSLTKPDLDAAQAAFDGAEARVAAARAEVELALTALRDCELVSPVSGIILERRIEVGTLAAAGTVGFVLGDLSSVKARFGIPDSMIQSVALGEAIDVTVDALAASTFSGHVTAIAPAADPQSRVFDIEVTIPNQDGRLRPGMIGAVAISRQSLASPKPTAEAGLVLSLTAIVRSEAGTGQFGAFVVEQQDGVDVARLRHVELGEVLGNAVAVRTGVKPGERVVVSGATLLVDGAPVRVMP